MTNNKIIIMLAVIAILLFTTQQKEEVTIQTLAGEWDISEEVTSMGFDEFLVEEEDFDYSDPAILVAAQDIKSRTNSPKQAIKEVAEFVADNVRYSSQITVAYCYDEKASTALEEGFGDCVSMSRLATALLRAQGIPARTMGGCLSFKSSCTQVFATIPFIDAQVTPMTPADFKKRGFLHEWVEVWEPEEGWVLLEATSGQIFPLECQSYIEFGYDSNRFNRCVITDSSFWRLCQTS